MACNERMKEEFDTLHEAVLEMLKVRGGGCMVEGQGPGNVP
jgi:hypothetical protein